MVSIILPCYNAEKHLRASLESILAQDYNKLEVIAIDDGSVDATPTILADYAHRHKNIRLIRNEQNQGVAKALNQGVRLASGNWIARMDADDIAAPGRVGKQLSFLEQQPKIDVLGTSVDIIDTGGQLLFRNTFVPEHPEASHFISLFTTPVFHPTVMARAEIFQDNPYSLRPEHQHIEDLELWHRLALQGKKISNLQESLLQYRTHPGSISSVQSERQRTNLAAFVQKAISEHLGLPLSHAQVQELFPDGRPGDGAKALARFEALKTAFLRKFPSSHKAQREMKAFIGIHLASILARELSQMRYTDWRDCNYRLLLRDVWRALTYSGYACRQLARMMSYRLR